MCHPSNCDSVYTDSTYKIYSNNFTIMIRFESVMLNFQNLWLFMEKINSKKNKKKMSQYIKSCNLTLY